MALIQKYYHMPNYVQLRLPRPADVPTRPLPGCVAVYWDYFIRGLRQPLHPFIKEVLLNLEISIPQLNPNAYQCMVALWALYYVLCFPDLTMEELQQLIQSRQHEDLEELLVLGWGLTTLKIY